MKDIFSGQNIQRAFQNPLTMAGFAVMQGAPMGQALMQASEMQRQQQLAQAQMAEHQGRIQQQAQARLFAQNLPEALKGLGAQSLEDATAKLVAMGADPEMALKLAQNIRPDIKDKYNPVTGGIDTFENDRYKGPVSGGIGNVMPNAVNNTMQRPPIEGKDLKTIRELAASQGIDYDRLNPKEQSDLSSMLFKQQINPELAEPLKLSNDLANKAESALEKVKSMAHAFEEFDDATRNQPTRKSGSLIASPGLNNGSLGLSSRLLNDKARAQMQIIEKDKGQLAKLILASGITGKTEEQILKGLPDTGLLHEARNEGVYQLQKELSTPIISNKIMTEWYKQGGNPNEANVIIREILKSPDAFDTTGLVRENFEKMIPHIIRRILHPEEFQR